MQNGIQYEPAFAWWVPYVVRKRNSIINKAKTKYWQRTHEYGIRIPKSVKEAKEVDAENDDTLWQDAIAKEMTRVMTAIVDHEGPDDELIGYQGITGHLIFDVKLGENFRRKTQYCYRYSDKIEISNL